MKFLKYFSDIWILCVILFMPFVLFWKIDRLQTDIEKNLGQKPIIKEYMNVLTKLKKLKNLLRCLKKKNESKKSDGKHTVSNAF